MLLPGTCCHWKAISIAIPLLADNFRVLCVGYDGFDGESRTDRIFHHGEQKATLKEPRWSHQAATAAAHKLGQLLRGAAGGRQGTSIWIVAFGQLRSGSGIAAGGGKIADRFSAAVESTSVVGRRSLRGNFSQKRLISVPESRGYVRLSENVRRCLYVVTMQAVKISSTPILSLCCRIRSMWYRDPYFYALKWALKSCAWYRQHLSSLFFAWSRTLRFEKFLACRNSGRIW